MPQRKKSACQICNTNEIKYTCPCGIFYCSVGCYKQHKESSCAGASSSPKPAPVLEQQQPSPLARGEVLEETKPLRPLTSLKWPYVPEEPAYPDPLERDDPKPLQLRHYEAIATSQRIRTILSNNLNLRATLRDIDRLKGSEREEALQKALGVHELDRRDGEVNEEMLVLREFAEVIEAAVRGDNADALGLRWGD
ncbi:hit-type zinc finger protein [Moniliophthora roreri MCA 2997]|uniref:Hit-type zinc finger protein n=1 Tax=Moniliophthora roreri (strain MCA 2997) TaxID=1381753 RepID=V2WN77_MONRO|nr:hit-type zinc finger protein [Moniliophthora roreri MCA 2997]